MKETAISLLRALKPELPAAIPFCPYPLAARPKDPIASKNIARNGRLLVEFFQFNMSN